VKQCWPLLVADERIERLDPIEDLAQAHLIQIVSRVVGTEYLGDTSADKPISKAPFGPVFDIDQDNMRERFNANSSGVDSLPRGVAPIFGKGLPVGVSLSQWRR
jgi:hypothetical protein